MKKVFYAVWTIFKAFVKGMLSGMVKGACEPTPRRKEQSVEKIDCYQKEVDYQYFYGSRSDDPRPRY